MCQKVQKSEKTGFFKKTRFFHTFLALFSLIFPVCLGFQETGKKTAKKREISTFFRVEKRQICTSRFSAFLVTFWVRKRDAQIPETRGSKFDVFFEKNAKFGPQTDGKLQRNGNRKKSEKNVKI
jgi:hypothetical protein